MNAIARHIVVFVIAGWSPPLDAHHRHRPVVVIPLNSVGIDAPAPWQGEEA